MKKLACAIAVAGLTGTPAFAADMAVKGPPAPPPVPAFNWTGFYIGINGGGAWGNNNVATFGPGNSAAVTYFTGEAVVSPIGSKPSGGLVGGQIGYNWQWVPQWVLGIETDLDWADIQNSGSFTTHAPGFATFITSAEQKLTAIGTVRARIGFVFADRALFYATGGLAYGDTKNNTSIITPGFCGPAGLCAAASSNEWRTGWTAGGGIEWAFGPPWTLKVEYLHYDLGSHSQNQFDPNDVPPIPVFTSTTTFRGDIVRAGINYKF
jgi:outer membrane immunogenic protein